MKSVLPADTFIVVNKTTLSDNDRNLLILLYQPIVGSQAISLYYTLWSYLDKSELLSNEWTHHHILRDMMISNSEFIDAKVKLEAIGLIKSNNTKRFCVVAICFSIRICLFSIDYLLFNNFLFI